MKEVQLSCITLVYCPGFTSIEQSDDDSGSVHLEIGLCSDTYPVSHVLVDSAECETGFSKSDIDLVIDNDISG